MKKSKIYIIHGWAYTTEKWMPFIEFLKKHGIGPVMLKVPGLTAPLKEVWTLEDYVEWLRNELEHEKEKIILLGHSNGGRISLAFAHKYPEKIKELILFDSAGIYHNELPIRLKRFIFGNLARFGRKFTNSDFLRKLLYKLTRESDYEKADPILRKTLHNLVTRDISKLFQQIHLPVVIIWGEEDTITPFTDGKKMHTMLKNSKLFPIKNARHSPMFTNVEEAGEIVLGELRSKKQEARIKQKIII